MEIFGNKKIIALGIISLIIFGANFSYPAKGYSQDNLRENKKLKVYMTRHAETMGNVTGNYSEQNQRTFSEKGLGQIKNINDKFKDYYFDYIFVSPTYRTQHTILPYLKAHNNITGEIWPEIEEACFDITASTIPSETIPKGKKIELFDDKYLKLRNASSSYRYKPHNAPQALAQFIKAQDMIKKYSKTGKSLLLVCHYCTGTRLMEILLGLEQRGRFTLNNCAVSLLEEQDDGSFIIVEYNDKPFRQQFYWKQENIKDETIKLHLFPKRFLNNINKKHTVRWKAYDEENNLIYEGGDSFLTKKREENALLDIEIPTDKFKRGSICDIETEISCIDESVYKWKDKFLIPTYKDLKGEWLINKQDDITWSSQDINESEWEIIDVPAIWEKTFIGAYDGIAWYRLHFNISDKDLKEWRGKKIAFVMGAVDDADETFLNGVMIGKSGKFPPDKKTAWDRPRIYFIEKDFLKYNNVLAVRVNDWGGNGGIWRGPVAIGPVNELKTLLNKDR